MAYITTIAVEDVTGELGVAYFSFANRLVMATWLVLEPDTTGVTFTRAMEP